MDGIRVNTDAFPPCIMNSILNAAYLTDIRRRAEAENITDSFLHEAGLSVSEIDRFKSEIGFVNPDDYEQPYQTHVFAFQPITCNLMVKKKLCRKNKYCKSIVFPIVYYRQRMSSQSRQKQLKGSKYGGTQLE